MAADRLAACSSIASARVVERRHTWLTQHRVLRGDAEDAAELLRHLDQEHVQPDQHVAGEAVAHRQIDVRRRQPVLDLREIAVLLDAGDLAAERAAVVAVFGMWQPWQDCASGPAPNGSLPSGVSPVR